MQDVKLNTLLKLYELKSTTKVAQILNFSQPVVSQHIKCLEELYKIKIFKEKSKYTLTEEGSILYRYALVQSNAYNACIDNLKKLKQEKNIIRIATTPQIYHLLINNKISNFLSSKIDGYSLRLDVFSKDLLIEKLNDNSIDYIFYDESLKSDKYVNISLFTEEISLLVKENATNTKISINDISKKYEIYSDISFSQNSNYIIKQFEQKNILLPNLSKVNFVSYFPRLYDIALENKKIIMGYKKNFFLDSKKEKFFNLCEKLNINLEKSINLTFKNEIVNKELNDKIVSKLISFFKKC